MTPAERKAKSDACRATCKDNFDVGMLGNLTSAGRKAKRNLSKCLAECTVKYGSEDSIRIDELASTIAVENGKAQFEATQQIADCAQQYLALNEQLDIAYDKCYVGLVNVAKNQGAVDKLMKDGRADIATPGTTVHDVDHVLGSQGAHPGSSASVSGRSAYNVYTQEEANKVRAEVTAEHERRAQYHTELKSYGGDGELKNTNINPETSEAQRVASQRKLLGSPDTTKPGVGQRGCTGDNPYWNFETITFMPDSALEGLGVMNGIANTTAANAKYGLSVGQGENASPGYPFMYVSCLAALFRQVEALLDAAKDINENDILALQSQAEPEEGAQSPYNKVTERITGVEGTRYGTEYNADSPVNNTNGTANVPRGASVGILTHGAPRYWPTNFSDRDHPGLTSDADSGGKALEGLTNAVANFSLRAWVDRVATMNLQYQAWGVWMTDQNTISDSDLTILQRGQQWFEVIDTFVTSLMGIVDDMQEAAKCIYDADRAADNVINANDQKLKDELPSWADHTFDGALDPFDWIGVNNPDDLRDQINEARSRLREQADAGGAGIFGALPEKLFFKEQCFLLSYIGIFADWKKYYLDRANVRRNASDAIISGVAAKGHKKLPYSNVANLADKPGPKLVNASLLVDGDPYGFINKLTASPHTYQLNNIENWELSNLQPKIRLFKVVYDANGNEREVELKFDSHFSTQDMSFFQDKASRGAGVGLKSFNFTYDGSNPFAAKKSIKAKLVLFANTFQELLRERTGKVQIKEGDGPLSFSGEKYKYVELALKTGAPYKAAECKPNQDYLDMIQENEEMGKLNFRLKAVVGLSAPTGINGLSAASAETIQKAVDDSFVTLNLTPTVHDFDFDEQGRVNFTINYLAYVDDFFDQSGYNVFADPSGKLGYRRIVRELQMKTYQRDCSGGNDTPTPPAEEGGGAESNQPRTSAENLAAIKEQFAQEVQKDQLDSVSKLIDTMSCANVIYYVNVPYSEVRQFLHEGPFVNYNKYVSSYKEKTFIQDNASQSTEIANSVATALHAIESAKKAKGQGEIQRNEKNEIAASLAVINPNENNVAFFYVSDLVDVILANIQQELEELPTDLAEGKANGTIQDTTKCDINQKIRELKLYEQNFKRMRILLGPVEVLHQKPDQAMLSVFVNFGDLPISLKYFLEWLTTAVLKREENQYPLSKFLNDFFNLMVRNFLNNDSCFAYNIAQSVRVNQAVLTSYARGDDDNITAAIKSKLPTGQARINLSDFKMPATCPSDIGNSVEVTIDDSDLPILNVAGVPGSRDSYAPLSSEINYFIYFAGRTMPTEKQRGSRCQDEDAGIQHYLLGRNKGLVKNIKLSKTDSPGLAEVRFEQDGYDGLRQLRNVYDVQIESFANVQTFPGSYIYVAPSGFDPSVAVDNDGFDLTDMGIGGYCMIVRSEHEFGEGYANSTIHAKWVASVDGYADEESSSQTENTNQNAAKCGIYAYRHNAVK